MTRLGATLRLLAILLCLVPFTSARQAVGKGAPPASAAGPGSESPAPAGEEDDEREAAGAKERLVSQPRHRPPLGGRSGTLPLLRPARASPAHGRPASPFDADPFRNGLGSPYRC
jgi:hypothetical protein